MKQFIERVAVTYNEQVFAKWWQLCNIAQLLDKVRLCFLLKLWCQATILQMPMLGVFFRLFRNILKIITKKFGCLERCCIFV